MITKTGFLLYRAPELLEDGPFGYSANVDIWSVGVSLYFMLSGKPAFQSER
jgi:serine/threonine protein kinase